MKTEDLVKELRDRDNIGAGLRLSALSAADRLEAILWTWEEAESEQRFLVWLHKRLPALKAAITGETE